MSKYYPLLTTAGFQPGPIEEIELVELSSYLASLQRRYFKGAFQSVAEAAAVNINITDDILDVDDLALQKCGSLLQLISDKQARNKPSRFNLERCNSLFPDDPRLPTLQELATVGAVIDTDSEFIRQSVPEPFRPCEVILTHVFQKHGLDSWTKDRGLLVRLATLITTGQIHLCHFNANHLVYKATDEYARWCVDPSNRSDDAMPLNGGFAKDFSIKRYAKTWCPSLLEMLIAFNAIRIALGCTWDEMWLFKEDIKACFPQMDLAPESAPLLSIRLTPEIVFIHLAGCFGWTGAPMAWSIIGEAMRRKVVAAFLCLISVFLICDDFCGIGSKKDADAAALFIRNLIEATCGPNSVSLDKSVLAQQAEMLGWFINLLNPLGASITPKDDAIDKMTYYFFNFDPAVAQQLLLWQVLHAFAERYSYGIRGMRPFVSSLAHMIRKCGGGPTIPGSRNNPRLRHQTSRPKVASASAQFSIEMWRVVCLILYKNKAAFSIPIEHYIQVNGGAKDAAVEFHSVSDASPYRICVALYTQPAHQLVGWSSVLLPYPADTGNQFQTNREYIGLILTLILIARLFPHRLSTAAGLAILFRWINDNTGALAWADKTKSTSLPSIVANMFVAAFQMHTNVTLTGSEHLPGVWMGDIDRESRREDHLAKGNFNYAPTLLPELFVNLESDVDVMEILALCSPHDAIHTKAKDFHLIYQTIHHYLQKIIN